MNIYKDINSLPDFNNAVITIGSFDGVHRGHQKIIKRIKQLAKEINGESVIITFDPHPRKIIYPKDNSLKLLNSLEEKLHLCEKYGVDNVVIVPFSIEFSQQHPQEYIEKFILGKFNPRYIVIGYDHRFGLNRKGDIDMLKHYAQTAVFDVILIKKQDIEEITISSSKIRKAIEIGDIKTANDFLNHNYKLSGIVVHGDKIGQTIGYPTANIKITEKDKLVPQNGVYAVSCTIEGLEVNGMMYIGNRPTIKDGNKERKIEVNLFDFNDNIYDKKITINVLSHIRSDMKFDSLESLKGQLAIDRIDVMSFLNNVPTKYIPENNVTIAILNYNGANYLEAYLPQVLFSSIQPINVTVIDNASTDESVSYIKEWHPEIQIIELTKNHGFAEGYNRGMEYIDSKYTVILNSDVEVSENWLDPILQQFEEDEQIGIIQPKILSLEERSKFEYAGACGGLIDNLGYPYCRGRIFDTVETDEGQYDTIMEIDWASGAAMVVKTELFEKLGGFDGDYFAHMEEIDFCTRVKTAGYKIVVVPEAVVYHLGGGTLSYQSPQKTYLNFRNSLFTILKNEPISKLFWLLPLRLVLDGIAGVKFLFDGKYSFILSIIKAHFSFYKNFFSTIKKRKSYNILIDKYKHEKKSPSTDYSASIIVDYYLRGKKSFLKL